LIDPFFLIFSGPGRSTKAKLLRIVAAFIGRTLSCHPTNNVKALQDDEDQTKVNIRVFAVALVT